MTEQLTGTDASLLALESPALPLHVVGVVVLDPAKGEGFSAERLRAVIAERVPLMPPFLRRLVHVPFALDHPYWAYDESVDLSAHVFDARLSEPRDMRALGVLVGEIAGRLLDRDKPLWELHVVEPMVDGRVAMIAKVHHATLYGSAGAAFLAELFDFTPEPRELAVPNQGASGEPSGWAITSRTALNQLRRPLSAARFVVAGARSGVTTVGALTRWARGHGRDLPIPAPRVGISGRPTTRRVAGFATLSLPLVKEVKDTADATVNDVVLACVALSLQRYLAARNDLPSRPLVAAIPVNAGDGEAAGTNLLNAMVVALPTDVGPSRELLERVSRSATAAKQVTAAVGVTALAELAEATPPAALSAATWVARTLRMSAARVRLQNFIVSNVMGPPVPLYIAGALVDSVYPLGPLMLGSGMNITVLSNLDRLDVGIMACPDLVDDVWEIADALPVCLDELAAASVTTRMTTPAASSAPEMRSSSPTAG